MKQRSKRLTSLLLTLVMVLGMLPATTLTANALMYTGVDTWEELVEELTTGDAGYIMLEDDIKYKHYYKYHENNPEGLVFETIEINGTKTLDLNGYSIEVIDESNAAYDSYLGVYQSATTAGTLFEIPADSQLTINDATGDGEITYKAYFNSIDYLRNEYEHVDRRDIFDVLGTLIVNGGKILAGDVKKKYVMAGLKDPTVRDADADPVQISAERYDGYARQQIWGTAADVYSSGTLVVNGGELAGRGFGWTTGDGQNMDIGNTSRDAVVEISGGGTVLVNGGSFKANGGANVFAGGGVGSGLTVRAGYFKTDKHDNIICPGPTYVDNTRYYENGTTLVETGSYGNLGIPDSAWTDEAARMRILVDNAIYNGNAAGEVDLDKTGGQTSGESLEVTIVPLLSDNKLPVTLNGGPYSNYPVSDGQVIDWNVKSDNLVATVDYEPYFDDTTGLKDAAPVYTWHLWGNYGTNGEVSKDIVTTTGRLDISAAWEEAAGTGNFRQMKVSCVVSEAPTNCTVRMETKTNEFRLDPTKTPLDESSLPGGKMEVDISYPGFSGSNTDIVVTVKPSAEDLADAAYGSSTVRYEFMYRDGEVDLEDEPFAWYNNTYNFNDTDWGHVKFDVTMIVHGADGIGRRFTKSAWALKLPDITVSGATLNSDKTAYVGNPGSPVTLKAPIDVTNADVAADKIVASDIAGLYRITYDNSGNPVMSLVTAGSYTQYQVTGNGTYCYAAYDRDGNLVYSKPVKVEFNAEAYGINITKSNDYIFTVYNNGSVVMPLTITATYGSSVEEGNIRWAIQSYPQGMSTSDFTYVNAHGKSAISFQKLFEDVKTIVPGNYLVMAYVVKDGQYLTASNAVTVQVGRIADFVDITDEAGNVISGKTMEGPYVGNTMKLNCVPGNGASAPSVYTVAWTVESLVGTNVATIDANGVLTINKPGQIKVTATATVGVGQTALANNTQTVIINIPITEVEVTLGTPTIGGDPDAIASVPADAPYELVYNPEYSWISGVHPDTDKFYGNGIPQLSVDIAPKDGYVFPARQSELTEGDKTWYTYADDIIVKVNGTAYNFRDFEKTYVYGSTQFGNDDYDNFYEAQEIDFYWTWDRLKDASHTYLDYVNLTAPIPAVGDGRAAFNFVCSNSDTIYASAGASSIYLVSGDYLNDNDITNDNAVKMGENETYQKGQVYRANLTISTTKANYTTYFAENVTVMVNGTKCYIKPISGTEVEGQQLVYAYLYFMPTAEIKTIENLYIDDLEAPVGYQKPATADDITEFLTNFAIDDEVYVTRLTWFYDVNNNGVIDTGEDSGDSFNADGSFIAGLRYSVYLELEARDRDDDGKGDFVKFADNAKIYLSSQSDAQMTGNQNGAVYKFPAATVPAKAVTTDPGQVTIELEEGYDFATKPVKTVNVTSVGTTEITSIIVEAEDSTLLLVAPNGMSFEVAPRADLAKGTYRTSVVIMDDDGNVLTTVPVTITVGEPAASTVLKGDVNQDGVITADDITELARHLAKVSIITETAALVNADTNSDGDVSADDLTLLAQYVAKIIDSFN